MSDNFWGNTQVQQSGVQTSAEIEPIPEGSIVTVVLEESTNDEYQGNKTAKMTMVVIDGEYKKRKIFSKLKINDKNDSTSLLAKEALMWLFKTTDTPLPQGIPTNEELMGMCMKQKPFKVKLGLWCMDKDPTTGEKLPLPHKKGNYVNFWLPMSHVEEVKQVDAFGKDEDVPF